MGSINKSSTDARSMHVTIPGLTGQIIIHSVMNGYLRGSKPGLWVKCNFLVLRYDKEVSPDRKKLTKDEQRYGKCVLPIPIVAQDLLKYQDWLRKKDLLSYCQKIGEKINEELEILGYTKQLPQKEQI